MCLMGDSILGRLSCLMPLCFENTHDMFVNIFGRIVELILDLRQILAGATHLIGIALCPNAKDDILGHNGFAIGQLNLKRGFVALDFLGRSAAVTCAHDNCVDTARDCRASATDRLDLSIIDDVDLVFSGLKKETDRAAVIEYLKAASQ